MTRISYILQVLLLSLYTCLQHRKKQQLQQQQFLLQPPKVSECLIELLTLFSLALPIHLQFTAGAVAGVSEILFMYPLDGKKGAEKIMVLLKCTISLNFLVVKTRFQLQKGKAEYSSIFDCFRKIIKTEGVSKLYRGIAAPILVEAPKRATKFAANEQYSKLYMGLTGEKRMTQKLSIATGVSAGITEAFVVVSFELVKIRMQDRANAGKYLNTMDCVKKILLQEGPLAFFKGLESTIWRHAAWNGGYFGVIHGVKSMLPAAKTSHEQTLNNFIAGSIGGTFGTMLNTPFDVVKTRIQNQQPGVYKYNWTLPAVSTIIKEEG